MRFPEIKQYLSEDLDIEQGDLRIRLVQSSCVN